MSNNDQRLPRFRTELPDLPVTRLVMICNARQRATDPVRLDDHDDRKIPTALGDEGREQADRLAARLSETGEVTGAVALLTSSARRAIETAEVIARAVGIPVTGSDCGFCEPHSGECDGMIVEEWLATLAKERIAHWSPYAPKSPGGEAVGIAMDRAARALIEAVLEHAGGTIVVITHTIPLRASLWSFLGLPFHGLYAYPEFTYTGITEWKIDGWLPGTGQMRAGLVRYNDTAHLQPGAWTKAPAPRDNPSATS